MVNIVIVSHCHQLAEGVKTLADQMSDDAIKITAVGGIVADGGYELGTDAVRISQAVRDTWTPDGVLLLVDLGSAVLSAELAIDLLEPDMRSSCMVSNAPLVEGAVVAALEASVGHDLRAVNAAAEAAGQFPKVTREP